jgi:uncharacterized protein (TIGR00162 family)
MVCTVHLTEKPELNNPILIEGLPGIGFVANIATLHLINELKTPKFGQIHSSSFQDLAITADNGKPRYPTNELYYHKARDTEEHDLIILYGNTQALTTTGQYELCGKILETAQNLNTKLIITLGGLRRDEKITQPPKLYCAASNPETLKQAQDLGAQIIEGQIYGIAGLLIGLSPLYNINAFCLLSETPGYYADAAAAREVLQATNKILHLKADMTRLDKAAETTHEILKTFGMTTQPPDEKAKQKETYTWRI